GSNGRCFRQLLSVPVQVRLCIDGEMVAERFPEILRPAVLPVNRGEQPRAAACKLPFEQPHRGTPDAPSLQGRGYEDQVDGGVTPGGVIELVIDDADSGAVRNRVAYAPAGDRFFFQGKQCHVTAFVVDGESELNPGFTQGRKRY